MAWVAPTNFANGNVLNDTDLDVLSTDITWLHDLANLITGSTAADSGDSTKLHILRAAAATVAYDAGVTGDTVMRFRIAADGTMEWGAGGAAATDVNLYRGAANQLKTDDDVRVGAAATGLLGMRSNAGAITDALFAGTAFNGAFGWNSSTKQIYVRSAGAWFKSAAFVAA